MIAISNLKLAQNSMVHPTLMMKCVGEILAMTKQKDKPWVTELVKQFGSFNA
jgi:hypothetical protein